VIAVPPGVSCKFIRVRDVSALTSISVRDIWRKVHSDPDFPRPRKLSKRRTVWVRDEVTGYVNRIIGIGD